MKTLGLKIKLGSVYYVCICEEWPVNYCCGIAIKARNLSHKGHMHNSLITQMGFTYTGREESTKLTSLHAAYFV